eukprot:gene3850-15148_t
MNAYQPLPNVGLVCWEDMEHLIEKESNGTEPTGTRESTHEKDHDVEEATEACFFQCDKEDDFQIDIVDENGENSDEGNFTNETAKDMGMKTDNSQRNKDNDPATFFGNKPLDSLTKRHLILKGANQPKAKELPGKCFPKSKNDHTKDLSMNAGTKSE